MNNFVYGNQTTEIVSSLYLWFISMTYQRRLKYYRIHSIFTHLYYRKWFYFSFFLITILHGIFLGKTMWLHMWICCSTDIRSCHTFISQLTIINTYAITRHSYFTLRRVFILQSLNRWRFNCFMDLYMEWLLPGWNSVGRWVILFWNA
jgi:hypothetical protein